GLHGGGDRIGDVGETTRLHAVADHGHGLVAQRLPEEDRDHASHVDCVEARTVHVEITYDGRLQPHLRVGETEVLADRLGSRVAPAVDPCGAEHPVGVLAPGNAGITP